jgi:murein L,D-transpeptidase YafK
MRSIAKILVIALAFVICSGVLHGKQMADFVLVVKSESRLYLLRDQEVFASYRIKFGSNPKGHKQQQGDERTPEGRYILDYKNSNSSFYKSIHISYPNAEDRARARKRGVSPGGDIMIHGQSNGWGSFGWIIQFFNWTNGCIALTDSNMDRVWAAVEPGTPIEIRP